MLWAGALLLSSCFPWHQPQSREETGLAQIPKIMCKALPLHGRKSAILLVCGRHWKKPILFRNWVCQVENSQLQHCGYPAERSHTWTSSATIRLAKYKSYHATSVDAKSMSSQYTYMTLPPCRKNIPFWVLHGTDGPT